MPMLEIITRMALTATPSASFLSPRPTQRPAAMAGLRSGCCLVGLMWRMLSVVGGGPIPVHGRGLDREPDLAAWGQLELGRGLRSHVGQQRRLRADQEAYGVPVLLRARDPALP